MTQKHWTRRCCIQFRAMAKERGLPLGHAETIIGAIVAMAYNIQGEEAA
jgi:hypothetical protein